MAVKQEVAVGIAKGLAEFWKCEEFRDFTVKIGTVEFGCHQLILAACSDFFRGLFRSGMQETEQKCATLHNISSEIFELLLESMYTGHDVLTNDNVIDIWKAAHQLQIHFMVSECENFAIRTMSLENYILYLQTSKALNSTITQKTAWIFIQINCSHFFKTRYFLEIPIEEVEILVKSQNLATSSEDDVIHAIVNWAELSLIEDSHIDIPEINKSKAIFEKEDNDQECSGEASAKPCKKKSKKCHSKDNDDMVTADNELDKSVSTDLNGKKQYQADMNVKDLRSKYLTRLLSNARAYVVTQECLKMLANHALVRHNVEAKDIIIEALFYQLQVNKRNGHWPLKAIHRNNSKHKHCLVTVMNIERNAIFNFYILARKQWLELPRLNDIKEVKLAASENKLYAMCIKPTHDEYKIILCGPRWFKMKISLHLLKTDKWLNINFSLILSSQTFSFALVGSVIYIFSAEEMKMWKVDTTTYVPTEMPHLRSNLAICHVLTYEKSILLFYASTNQGEDETIVHCYDTSENTWTELNTLSGTANGMTSFIDEHFSYLLQSNGSMWKVVKLQSKEIDFEYVASLWDFNWPLYGAATFMDELYIHGSKSEATNSDLQRSLTGVFSKINYLFSNSNETGMTIPYILETINEDQK